MLTLTQPLIIYLELILKLHKTVKNIIPEQYEEVLPLDLLKYNYLSDLNNLVKKIRKLIQILIKLLNQ